MTRPLRMTHQRELILKELTRSRCHPTADELYERVRKKLPRISLATVYRNLEILSGAGLIRKIEITGRQKRFDWEVAPHHHVHCIDCQRVDNIELDLIGLESLAPEAPAGYTIDGCRVEFFGICPDCRKSKQQTNDKE